MGIATSKTDSMVASQTNFKKLFELIDSMTEKEKTLHPYALLLL